MQAPTSRGRPRLPDSVKRDNARLRKRKQRSTTDHSPVSHPELTCLTPSGAESLPSSPPLAVSAPGFDPGLDDNDTFMDEDTYIDGEPELDADIGPLHHSALPEALDEQFQLGAVPPLPVWALQPLIRDGCICKCSCSNKPIFPCVEPYYCESYKAIIPAKAHKANTRTRLQPTRLDPSTLVRTRQHVQS